jgi:hypothetical protein
MFTLHQTLSFIVIAVSAILNLLKIVILKGLYYFLFLPAFGAVPMVNLCGLLLYNSPISFMNVVQASSLDRQDAHPESQKI